MNRLVLIAPVEDPEAPVAACTLSTLIRPDSECERRSNHADVLCERCIHVRTV